MTEQAPTEEPQSTPESHLQSSTSVTSPQSPSESPLSPHPPPVSPKTPKWALSTSLSVAGPQQGTLTLREGPVQQHAGYLKRRTSVLKRWKKEVFEIVPGKRYQNKVSRLQTQKLSANCITTCKVVSQHVRWYISSLRSSQPQQRLCKNLIILLFP